MNEATKRHPRYVVGVLAALLLVMVAKSAHDQLLLARAHRSRQELLDALASTTERLARNTELLREAQLRLYGTGVTDVRESGGVRTLYFHGATPEDLEVMKGAK
jgi:hypothetical protein